MTTKSNVPTKKASPASDVAVSESAVPEYLRGKQGAGTENLGQTDIEIPRIKLMQALSPEVSTYDVKPGEFWHTLAEMSLGREVLIVPIYTDKRFILWKPRDAGGGILARADDGIHWTPANQEFLVPINKGAKTVKWKTAATVVESGLDAWGSYDPDDSNSQPAATLMYTFVVVMPDYPSLGPAVLSLQRSSVKTARNLIGKIKIVDCPSYGRIFRMSSMQETSQNGTFNNYHFHAEGFVPESSIGAYEMLYNQFKKTGVNIRDLEGAQEDEVSQSSGTAAKGNY